MAHKKIIGKCDHCGGDVLTSRDRKDHVIGEASHHGLHKFQEGDRFGAV